MRRWARKLRIYTNGHRPAPIRQIPAALREHADCWLFRSGRLRLRLVSDEPSGAGEIPAALREQADCWLSGPVACAYGSYRMNRRGLRKYQPPCASMRFVGFSGPVACAYGWYRMNRFVSESEEYLLY